MKTKKALTAALRGNWELANTILGGFGVEYASIKGRDLKYINMGDTYEDTVCREIIPGHTEKLPPPFVGSWGDWLESAENDYCEETDSIRCGYCGEFTENDKNDCRDVVCNSCGNCVMG